MGCGCGGAKKAVREKRSASQSAAAKRQTGTDPKTYWNGPERKKAK